MAFLYLLEKIRVPVVNEFMLGITYLGDEIAFLVVALILIWCADKRTGYYVLAVGFMGTIANQFMKLWFRIPRPWVLDENFTILKQAREGASGYSFPSGHTQSSVGTFGAIGYTTKNKIIRLLCVAVIILVPFSRMYLGVHTPLDVSVSLLVGAVLVFGIYPFFEHGDEKPLRMYVMMGALAFCSLLYVLFVCCRLRFILSRCADFVFGFIAQLAILSFVVFHLCIFFCEVIFT